MTRPFRTEEEASIIEDQEAVALDIMEYVTDAVVNGLESADIDDVEELINDASSREGLSDTQRDAMREMARSYIKFLTGYSR